MLAKGQLQSLIKVVRHFCWHFLFTPSEAIAFCSLFFRKCFKGKTQHLGLFGILVRTRTPLCRQARDARERKKKHWSCCARRWRERGRRERECEESIVQWGFLSDGKEVPFLHFKLANRDWPQGFAEEEYKKKTLYNRGVCFRSLDAFFSFYALFWIYEQWLIIETRLARNRIKIVLMSA